MIFSPMVLRVLASVNQIKFFPQREISFSEQSKTPFRLAVDGVSGIPSSQISISSFSRLLLFDLLRVPPFKTSCLMFRMFMERVVLAETDLLFRQILVG